MKAATTLDRPRMQPCTRPSRPRMSLFDIGLKPLTTSTPYPYCRSADRESSGRRIEAATEMVPLAGIEPALLAELDFESSASTNSAIGAQAGRPGWARTIRSEACSSTGLLPIACGAATKPHLSVSCGHCHCAARKIFLDKRRVEAPGVRKKERGALRVLVSRMPPASSMPWFSACPYAGQTVHVGDVR